MANGFDKNWVRVCAAIDGFRESFGRWPKRVRIMPVCYIDLVSEVLTPIGFALLSSVVELVPEDDAEMIADDDTGAEFDYGQGTCTGSGRKHELDQETIHWFGDAILRHD